MSAPGWAKQPSRRSSTAPPQAALPVLEGKGPLPRPRRRHDAPQRVACRWSGALGHARDLVAPYRRLDLCRGTRLRGPAEPPECALVDCGAPACQERTRSYAAQLAAAGVQR